MGALARAEQGRRVEAARSGISDKANCLQISRAADAVALLLTQQAACFRGLRRAVSGTLRVPIPERLLQRAAARTRP